jgi:hypothetical protein
MCFSEEVSFITAGTLAAVSAGCFYLAGRRKEFYALAAIPFFFALQQAAEGVQWLVFKKIWGTGAELSSGRDLFLFIAYVVWPFWIPFSLLVAENQTGRQRWLQLLLSLGLIVSLYAGWKILFFPVDSSVKNQSIHYSVDVGRLWIWPYFAATILPWFVSSLPFTTLWGVVLAIGAFIASYYYYIDFVSIWCFFAALVSVLVLLILKTRESAYTHRE